MVIDSSVLIAILLKESEAEHFTKLLLDVDGIYISAVSIVESAMVIEYKKGEQGAIQYDELLKAITPIVIAFDARQATLGGCPRIETYCEKADFGPLFRLNSFNTTSIRLI